MAVLKQYLGVVTQPVYCTKIASKLVRTFTDRHGLKDLCKEMLGIELKKAAAILRLGRRRTDTRSSSAMPPPTCCISTP